MPDLTQAMGINRPSLYAAFGNKAELFRKVVDRYIAGAARHMDDSLQKSSAREAVKHLLRGAICRAGGSGIQGCLLVQGALSCSASAQPIKDDLTVRRAAGQAALQKRFERAAAEGETLPGQPVDLARYFMTLLNGMAVQSAGGATQEELMQVIDLAMGAWPKDAVLQ